MDLPGIYMRMDTNACLLIYKHRLIGLTQTRVKVQS